MKEYLPLSRIFHADTSNDSYENLEKNADSRASAESTFHSSIETSAGELFVATPRELTLQIESLLISETRISHLWRSIPGVIRWNFVVHYVSEELLSTNELEGVRSTRKEVESAIYAAKKQENSAESVRFSEFARLYLNLTDRDEALPRTLSDLRSIYDKVTDGEIAVNDVPDGEIFRKADVEVLGAHGTPIHAGVTGEAQIKVLLTEMLGIARSLEIPALQSAILSHFIFEYVHPFYDGNGRTGRYLLALYLRKVLSLPTVLSLSREIAENKGPYYKAFTVTEDPLNKGEATFFVATIVDYIEHAHTRLLEELGVKVDQLEKVSADLQNISQQMGWSRQEHAVIFAIAQEELFDTQKSASLAQVAEWIQMSKQSARKLVAKLSDEGYLTIVSRKPIRVRLGAPLLRRLDIS